MIIINLILLYILIGFMTTIVFSIKKEGEDWTDEEFKSMLPLISGYALLVYIYVTIEKKIKDLIK